MQWQRRSLFGGQISIQQPLDFILDTEFTKSPCLTIRGVEYAIDSLVFGRRLPLRLENFCIGRVFDGSTIYIALFNTCNSIGEP